MTNKQSNNVGLRTDKYFTKTRNVIEKFGEKTVKYGVFQRRDVLAATAPAVEFIKKHCVSAIVTCHYDEGAFVPAESKIMTIEGPMSELVELETQYLQLLGFSQVCAYNALHMSNALPKVPFLDMHGRHATGDDMMKAAAYGASVGSKVARLHGSAGFVGTSNDLTASYYPIKVGVGTMPHALIGYAGSTLEAVKLFTQANPDDQNVTVLVDYYGKEIDDAIESATWFYQQEENKDKTFGVRLDTHGGRFAQGINYEKSVDVISKWLKLNQSKEYSIVRSIMGDEVFDMAGDGNIDKIRKILFGTGVSAANIINMRKQLNNANLSQVKIVASSGFDLFKCKIMSKVRAPIDMVGTGSFLPKTLSETYATSDIYEYDNTQSVKVGREWLFD